MFSNKFVIVLCVVGISKAYDDWKKGIVYLDTYAIRVLDSILPEYPCAERGGLCTIAADCPEGYLVKQSGLCPRQRSLGVECCYAVSVKETRCQKRGGDCVSDENPCKDIYMVKNVTDCPSHTVCCRLIY